jgi:hypothetical protein
MHARPEKEPPHGIRTPTPASPGENHTEGWRGGRAEPGIATSWNGAASSVFRNCVYVECGACCGVFTIPRKRENG